MYDAVIIGSGIGGLASACLLSERGKKVLVLEQSDRLGGCCASFDIGGHRFDVGAVFVLYRQLYERFFELLGLRFSDYVRLEPLDPVYDMRFDDGTSLLVPMDPVECADAIAQFAPDDRQGFLDFTRDMSRITDAAFSLTDKPFPPLEKFDNFFYLKKAAYNLKTLRALPLALSFVMTNQDRVNRRYLRAEKSLSLVSFENLFAGLPSDRINGLFAVMSYLGHTGYFYPRGGMGAIPAALARVARDNGCEIRTGSRVTGINIRNGSATGVTVEGEGTIASNVVLSNASAMPTYLDLVGRGNLPARFARAIEHYTPSICAPFAYFGLSQKPPELRCHFTVMVPPPERMNSYWDNYHARGLMPPFSDLPRGLLCPALVDPGLSPEGGLGVGHLSAGPYRLKDQTWDEYKPRFIEEIASDLDRSHIPGFRDMIDVRGMRTPLDFERELLLPGGSIYGLEMSVPNLGPFRPSWRSPVIRDLYLAGASTNPGGGVPLVMLSAMAASSCIVRDKNW